ncbi:ACN9 family protein [Phlyctema vagabunda]|uniref:Succinate dehydrogenase assembly factor 3 n=1 Tax=Phlyctema vagabunda TaxID=108571 RepID=A0ABR4PNE6_9HELO
MRVNPRLLMATPTSAAAFKASPMALLPPIPLYRRLFRAHRKHLPTEMRLLGDEYIKSEFRAHRDVENPVHIVRLWKYSGLTKQGTVTEYIHDRLVS